MYLTRTEAPVTYPVTLFSVKEQGRIDSAELDDTIERLIRAASALVGEQAGRVLSSETWAYSVPAILRNDLVLPKSPVQSVSSITYFDGADAEQTASVSDFYLMKGDDRAVLRPKSGSSWPTANTDRDDAITITFVAGYTTAPPALVEAVVRTVLHWFDNPNPVVVGSTATTLPLGVQELIDTERLGWFGA